MQELQQGEVVALQLITGLLAPHPTVVHAIVPYHSFDIYVLYILLEDPVKQTSVPVMRDDLACGGRQVKLQISRVWCRATQLRAALQDISVTHMSPTSEAIVT